jgi:predicted ATPase/DNA-binding CsgD family transcriptional regulator
MRPRYAEAFMRKALSDTWHEGSAQRPPDTPPDRSPDAELHRATVPRPLTRFIGREREISAITRQLQNGVRLLTLTGPGGVGKTRLAIEVAERAGARFDTAWFVPLAAIRDPALIGPAIMKALTRALTGKQRIPPEDLQAILGERPVLLVLDNFEHVQEAGPAVVDLLMACHSVTALVTSRAPLRVSGEHLYPVAPLSLPDGTDAMDDSEAMRLFTDRAAAVIPSFRLHEGNADIVGQVCAQLDGLPLAIELAAARLTLFSLAELLRRMDARLALLRDGPTDQPDRLRSLQASIAWSFDLLSAREQDLFARLAVFIGGWTLEAAEAVAGAPDGPDVQEGLSTLIGWNLVWRKAMPNGASRYGMLETIREFAEEQLVARGEAGSSRDRHAQWMVAFTWASREHRDSLSQILSIGPLEAEHANIREALRWLDATGQTGALAELVTGLEHHWEWNKHEAEGLGWYQRVLEIGDASRDVRLQALLGASFLSHKIASPLAEGIIDEFVREAEHHGTVRQRAEACFIKGMNAEDTGDDARAETYLRMARDLANRIDETWLSLQYTYHLGVVALGQGELDRSMEIFDNVRTNAMKIDDPLIPAWCLVYQALIWCEREKPTRAMTLLGEHPDMNRVAYRQHEPLLRAVASVVACQLGDYRRAARLWGSAAHDVPMRHPEKEITDRSTEAARQALGEPAFMREWAAGNRMTPVEVHAEIMQLLAGHQSLPVDDRPSPVPFGLSPREVEVLRLIAAGKTDRQIADTLYVSRRTAEWHARNVLGKLGATNRAEAAALAARERLI